MVSNLMVSVGHLISHLSRESRDISILGPSINYVRTYGKRGVKSPIHLHCVLHAKGGEGVQIAGKIAYVINGRPHISYSKPNAGNGRSDSKDLENMPNI